MKETSQPFCCNASITGREGTTWPALPPAGHDRAHHRASASFTRATVTRRRADIDARSMVSR